MDAGRRSVAVSARRISSSKIVLPRHIPLSTCRSIKPRRYSTPLQQPATNDSTSPAPQQSKKIEIRYTDPKAASHLLLKNPEYKAGFLSAIASIPELARAYRDLDQYLKEQGYADPKNPAKMPDPDTRARMQNDQLLTEKSLLVQKLLRLHGIIRTVPTEGVENRPGPNVDRPVTLIDGVIPRSKLGLGPAPPLELSGPLKWFKRVFMTRGKEGA